MGAANRKPASINELFQFITYEHKKWGQILHNLQTTQRRDFNVDDYVVKELEETEANWREIRRQKNKPEVAYVSPQIHHQLSKQKDKIRRLSSHNGRLQHRNQQLEGEKKDMLTKLSSLQNANIELRSQRGAAEAAIEKRSYKEDAHGKKPQNDAEQKILQLKTQINDLENGKALLQTTLNSLETHVKFVEDEKAELLRRLSKIAGERLLDNNPAIADLSDPNRPTKLAEIYNEIYDNEWTDALSKLLQSGYDEETAIETLRLTLLNVLKFCEMKAQMVLQQAADAVNLLFEEYKQSVTVKDVPAHLTMQRAGARRRGDVRGIFEEEIKLQLRWRPNGLDNARGISVKQAEIPEMGEKKEQLKAIAESKLIQLRKEVAVSMVPIVQQAYIEASWRSDCLVEIKDFIMKCLFLGWMMVVQSPPLVLAPCEMDEKFDKNLYKEYTKRGDLVDYVVWPAMLLHTKGAILSKGVAQGKKS